jgi:hypothetical protein
VGNDALSVMGGAYPGGGITLGPALTFGFIAGNALADATDVSAPEKCGVFVSPGQKVVEPGFV